MLRFTFRLMALFLFVRREMQCFECEVPWCVVLLSLVVLNGLHSSMCCSLIVLWGTCAESTGTLWAVSWTVPATYLRFSATVLAISFPSSNVCLLYKIHKLSYFLVFSSSAISYCCALLAKVGLDPLILLEAFCTCSNHLRRCSFRNVSVSISESRWLLCEW